MSSPPGTSKNDRTDWKPYPTLHVFMSNPLVNAVLCHAFCLNKKLFRDTSSCLFCVTSCPQSGSECKCFSSMPLSRKSAAAHPYRTWSCYNYATNANSTPTVTNRKGVSSRFFEKENLNHTLHQSANNERRVSNTCSQFSQPRSEPKTAL